MRHARTWGASGDCHSGSSGRGSARWFWELRPLGPVRTQAETEAQAEVPVRRVVPVTERRPAVTGGVAPVPAPVHPSGWFPSSDRRLNWSAHRHFQNSGVRVHGIRQMVIDCRLRMPPRAGSGRCFEMQQRGNHRDKSSGVFESDTSTLPPITLAKEKRTHGICRKSFRHLECPRQDLNLYECYLTRPST